MLLYLSSPAVPVPFPPKKNIKDILPQLSLSRSTFLDVRVFRSSRFYNRWQRYASRKWTISSLSYSFTCDGENLRSAELMGFRRLMALRTTGSSMCSLSHSIIGPLPFSRGLGELMFVSYARRNHTQPRQGVIRPRFRW